MKIFRGSGAMESQKFVLVLFHVKHFLSARQRGGGFSIDFKWFFNADEPKRADGTRAVALRRPDATRRLNRGENDGICAKIDAFLHKIDPKSRVFAGFFVSKKRRGAYHNRSASGRGPRFGGDP
jgi:hypothetical protein